MSTMLPVTTRQEAARGRNDDGNEAAATWIAAANTTYALDKADAVSGVIPFRHRFLLQEVGGAGKTNWRERIEFSKNGGAWTAIAATGDVRWLGSGFYADNSHTLQRIGSGTFVTTNNAMTELLNEGNNSTPDLVGNDEFEAEFMLGVLASAFTVGVDDFQLRSVIGSGSTPLDEYNGASIFDITIVDTGGPAARRRIIFT